MARGSMEFERDDRTVAYFDAELNRPRRTFAGNRDFDPELLAFHSDRWVGNMLRNKKGNRSIQYRKFFTKPFDKA